MGLCQDYAEQKSVSCWVTMVGGSLPPPPPHTSLVISQQESVPLPPIPKGKILFLKFTLSSVSNCFEVCTVCGYFGGFVQNAPKWCNLRKPCPFWLQPDWVKQQKPQTTATAKCCPTEQPHNNQETKEWQEAGSQVPWEVSHEIQTCSQTQIKKIKNVFSF